MITQINIVKEPEYYCPAAILDSGKSGLMTYEESSKLSDLPNASNIVQKSQTAGLLRNNGTVDTNSYVKESDIELEKTVSGNPITLTDAIAGNALEVSAEIVASQDLHGYDKPWVGGAGKNKLSCALTSGSDGNITYTVDSEGIITVSGSASGVVEKTIGTVYLTAGTYKLNGGEYPTSNVRIQLKDSGGNVVALSYNNDDASFTVSTAGNYTAWLTITPVTISGSTKLKPMIRHATVTDATFAPYSNICPITGFSSVTITDVDAESHTATVTVALGSTVYGGTLDLTSGELTVTHAIEDLSTLSWLVGGASSQLKYASLSGYTSVVMAEQYKVTTKSANELSVGECTYANNKIYVRPVSTSDDILGNAVLTLATPTTTTLTAEQLALVKGYNQLSCNSGDMSITYKASSLDAWKERVDELDNRVDELEDAVEDIEDRVDDVETALAGKANVEPYLEQSVTLSTSQTTTVTFTDARILATSFIEPAISVWGIFPEDVTVANGSCTVVMPKVSTAQTVTVGIFIKR